MGELVRTGRHRSAARPVVTGTYGAAGLLVARRGEVSVVERPCSAWAVTTSATATRRTAAGRRSRDRPAVPEGVRAAGPVWGRGGRAGLRLRGLVPAGRSRAGR
ncbi:hypothetical protein GCM10027451_29660 [Geodermatophilus aquaeductus]